MPAPVGLYLDIDGVISPVHRQDSERRVYDETNERYLEPLPLYDFAVWPSFEAFSMGGDHEPELDPMECDFPVAPAMLAALRALVEEFGLRVIWSSSWAYSPQMIERVMTRIAAVIPDAAVLLGRECIDLDLDRLSPKRGGVLADWSAHGGGPLIWADDDGIGRYSFFRGARRRGVFWGAGPVLGGTPRLLISPNTHAGLAPSDLARMRRFLLRLTRSRHVS